MKTAHSEKVICIVDFKALCHIFSLVLLWKLMLGHAYF